LETQRCKRAARGPRGFEHQANGSALFSRQLEAAGFAVREALQASHHRAYGWAAQALLSRPERGAQVRGMDDDEVLEVETEAHGSRWIKVALHIEEDDRAMQTSRSTLNTLSGKIQFAGSDGPRHPEGERQRPGTGIGCEEFHERTRGDAAAGQERVELRQAGGAHAIGIAGQAGATLTLVISQERAEAIDFRADGSVIAVRLAVADTT